MPFLRYRNVKVRGFAAAVPKAVINNSSNDVLKSNDYDSESFVNTTGVRSRHVSENAVTSDLCFAAAEKLINELGWDKSEIGALIFVTQTPDYILPATACILQDRLGLSKDCYALDIELGCSGWVYGIGTICGIINGGVQKALLLCGDARKFFPEKFDPLFGFAGTATALEFDENSRPIMCHYGTDGSGYDTIIIPHGGARNPICDASFVDEEIEGNMIKPLQGRMKGMDVFSFGISTAPKSVKNLAKHFEFDYLDADYYVFHQANKMMNDMIAKKLKLDPAKVPSSLEFYGNTSSASIPLTIVSQLRGKIENIPTKFICCGFGVGLSWGTVFFESDNLVIPNIIEI